MTIAPEREDTLIFPDLKDCDPDLAEVLAPIEDIYETAMDTYVPAVTEIARQSALTGAVTYSVDGTAPPESEPPAEGTSGTWTHTIDGAHAYHVIGMMDSEGLTTLYAMPSDHPWPRFTPENLYDAVRQTQYEEQVTPGNGTDWSDVLRWICECTPSRGALFRSGSYRVDPRTHTERVYDDYNAVQEQQEATLPERCERSVGLFQQQASWWPAEPLAVRYTEQATAVWADILSRLFT